MTPAGAGASPSVTSAGAVLVAAGLDPAEVRRRLPSVDPFAVPIVVAPGWFRALWARGITAIAMPWAVYVVPDVFHQLAAPEGTRATGTLMVHELVHIQQFRTLGALRHLSGYVAAYVHGRLRGRGHWDAYRAIPLEVEARVVAAHLGRPAGGGDRAP